MLPSSVSQGYSFAIVVGVIRPFLFHVQTKQKNVTHLRLTSPYIPTFPPLTWGILLKTKKVKICSQFRSGKQLFPLRKTFLSTTKSTEIIIIMPVLGSTFQVNTFFSFFCDGFFFFLSAGNKQQNANHLIAK